MEKSKDAAEQEKSALAASLVHANQRNTEDDVEAKANLESLLDEWDKVVRKQGFLQRLYDFGVCPLMFLVMGLRDTCSLVPFEWGPTFYEWSLRIT